MTIPTSIRKTIPFKQLYIDPSRNYRQDSPKVKEMGQSLKDNGQLDPIIVSNGGPDGTPYIVRGGFRRCAGFILNGWQNRDIDVTVREYKKGDAVSPLFDAIIHNKDREDVSALDMAEAIHQMVNGTYPVGEGETATPVDKKEIAVRLNLLPGTVNNFLRVFDHLDPDVAKKCRKAGAPMRLMVFWAGLKGTGRTDDAKAENLAAKQSEAFEEWLKAKTELEESGRQKKPRKLKGAKDGGEGGEGGEGGGGNDGSMVNKTKTAHLEACIEVLNLKLADADGDEAALLKGRIEALRFVTGDLKKLPGVNKSDLEALDVSDEPEEEEKATAEDE
jgi:ParB/RepB/Spo0J family partition protein